MLQQSAAASIAPTLIYSKYIPSYVPSGSLLFYYDFGVPLSYVGAGSELRDLVTGTRTASITGGFYSGSNGGEYFLTSGSYINLGNNDIYNLNTGPVSIFICFETLDTSKRSYVLNKKGSTGPGYTFNAVVDNTTISGSLREISKSNSGDYNTVNPGELGLGMVAYWSGSGSFIGPLNYPLALSVEAGQVTIFGGDAAAGAGTAEVGTVTNTEPLYVGRNGSGTDYANIKVQAIFGYSTWYETLPGLEDGTAQLAFRSNYTGSRFNG